MYVHACACVCVCACVCISQIVKQLIQAGSHPALAGQGWGLAVAATNGREEVVEHLLVSGDLCCVCVCVCVCVYVSLDVAVSTDTKYASAVWPDTYCLPLCVRLLQSLGVDPSVPQGRPLSGAAINGHENIVRQLLEAGADAHVSDTAMHTHTHTHTRILCVCVCLRMPLNTHVYVCVCVCTRRRTTRRL